MYMLVSVTRLSHYMFEMSTACGSLSKHCQWLSTRQTKSSEVHLWTLERNCFWLRLQLVVKLQHSSNLIIQWT